MAQNKWNTSATSLISSWLKLLRLQPRVKANPIINEEGRNLIKDFEDGQWRTKKVFKAYVDHIGNGKPVTIGYGYTNRAGYGPGVKIGDVWTKEFAEQNLDEGIKITWERIKPLVKVDLNLNQQSALISWVWNLGIGNLQASTFLKRLNAGDFEGAAEALTWYNKGTVNGRKTTLPGLVRRRRAEKELFLK